MAVCKELLDKPVRDDFIRQSLSWLNRSEIIDTNPCTSMVADAQLAHVNALWNEMHRMVDCPASVVTALAGSAFGFKTIRHAIQCSQGFRRTETCWVASRRRHSCWCSRARWRWARQVAMVGSRLRERLDKWEQERERKSDQKKQQMNGNLLIIKVKNYEEWRRAFCLSGTTLETAHEFFAIAQ